MDNISTVCVQIVYDYSNEKFLNYDNNSWGVMDNISTVCVQIVYDYSNEKFLNFVHRNCYSQCFLVGRTTPDNCRFSLVTWTPSNTWFLSLIRV